MAQLCHVSGSGKEVLQTLLFVVLAIKIRATKRPPNHALDSFI